MGVSSEARKITIESQANRTGYFSNDCIGNKHDTNEVCPASQAADCIKSGLDVGKICNFINETTNIEACLSEDAGRWDNLMYIHVI